MGKRHSQSCLYCGRETTSQCQICSHCLGDDEVHLRPAVATCPICHRAFNVAVRRADTHQWICDYICPVCCEPEADGRLVRFDKGMVIPPRLLTGHHADLKGTDFKDETILGVT